MLLLVYYLQAERRPDKAQQMPFTIPIPPFNQKVNKENPLGLESNGTDKTLTSYSNYGMYQYRYSLLYVSCMN
jgi:hypothetical protein